MSRLTLIEMIARSPVFSSYAEPFEQLTGIRVEIGREGDIPIVVRSRPVAFLQCLGAEGAARKLLDLFAVQLSELAGALIVCGDKDEPPMVAAAKQFVEENLTEPIALSVVARSISVSKFTLCKVFRRFTGMRFSHYVQMVRVERAKVMLLDPHISVTEIAFAVGFQSIAQFNRAFRKFSGLTPSEHRAAILPVPFLRQKKSLLAAGRRGS